LSCDFLPAGHLAQSRHVGILARAELAHQPHRLIEHGHNLLQPLERLLPALLNPLFLPARSGIGLGLALGALLLQIALHGLQRGAEVLLLQIGQLLKDPVQYIQIQFVGKLCIFKYRYKLSRGKKTLLRINPACQGLLITHTSARRSYDGLIIYLDPFF
jgi:hypothetical protein